MITTTQSGHYRLVETKHHIKILYLGDQSYAWIEPLRIGEILVATYKQHKTDCVLSSGRYHIYQVDDEPHLTDETHLELQVGPHAQQGYLLPTGLPHREKPRARIIATPELVNQVAPRHAHVT